MAFPAFILASALLVAAHHPAASTGGAGEGRLLPAALRVQASAFDSVTGACEGSLAPIGIVLPPGGGGTDCGSPLVLRHDWREGDPGTYALLDLPSCSDSWCRPLQMADKLRCEILIGNPCCWLHGLVGKELVAYPGNRVGPVSDALRGRFDADTDLRPGCYAQYGGNMARVLRVLIVEPTSARGRTAYRVVGGGRFFLRERRRDSDDLVGEMVPAPLPPG